MIGNYRGLFGYERQVISEMVESLRRQHFSAVPKHIDGSAAESPLFDFTIREQVRIPEEYSDRNRFLIVKARGNSMEPEIYGGDYVVIERFTRADQGSIALVHLDTEAAEEKYALKRYFHYHDHVELRSIDPAVPTMVYPACAVLSAERVIEVLEQHGRLT